MKISEIIEGEIRVYKSLVKELFNSIGDGVDSIRLESFNKNGKFTTLINEFHNEVIINLEDNPIDGISLSDWNRAKAISNLLKDKGYISDFSITPSLNRITLEFDENYPIVFY